MCILSDKLGFFIILPLVLVCIHSIFTLQGYQQTLLVSFVPPVAAHHCSDWLKDLHSRCTFLFGFLFCSSLIKYVIVSFILTVRVGCVSVSVAAAQEQYPVNIVYIL